MKTVLLAVAVLMGLWLPAAAQWRDRGEHRGWHDRGHWEHQRPLPPQGGGIDIGAIIGGIAGAFGGGRSSADEIRYCMQRYRSYNPETGIYYGYDGQPRRCP
jgi:hypothetical protein